MGGSGYTSVSLLMSALPQLQLRVHARANEIPREAWDALLSDDATPFQRWTWVDALEATGCACAERGWHPAHHALWRGNTLVALAPAYVRDDSHGEFVFDWSWARAASQAGIRYYPKLTFAVPFTPCTGPRVLTAPGEDRDALVVQLLEMAAALAQREKRSSVHVLFPTEREARALEEAGWAIRAGVQFHWNNAGYKTYDEFLARFDHGRRKTLRREAGAAAKQGIALRTRRGDELSPADAALVHRLYVSTVDKFAWGQRYLSPAFFARVLGDFREHLELVEAVREGEVIAGAFNVASATHLYGRYWGCFEEHPFLHFNVCYYHSIGECIRRGVRRFEGGAGGEHKLSRGFEPSVTWSAHRMFHSGLDRAVRDFVGREREAIVQQLPEIERATGFKTRDAAPPVSPEESSG